MAKKGHLCGLIINSNMWRVEIFEIYNLLIKDYIFRMKLSFAKIKEKLMNIKLCTIPSSPAVFIFVFNEQKKLKY